METAQILVRIPVELQVRLKMKLALERTSMRKKIQELIERETEGIELPKGFKP